MTLQTPAAAKTVSDNNQPVDTTTINSVIITELDAAITAASLSGEYKIISKHRGRVLNGLEEIEQSDRTFIVLRKVEQVLKDAGYSNVFNIVKSADGKSLSIQIQVGWSNG